MKSCTPLARRHMKQLTESEPLVLIYCCDNCGFEHKATQIAGQEFAYLDAGFGTLATPVGDKRDLCRSCMKAAENAHAAAIRECRASASIMRQRAIGNALGDLAVVNPAPDASPPRHPIGIYRIFNFWSR